MLRRSIPRLSSGSLLCLPHQLQHRQDESIDHLQLDGVVQQLFEALTKKTIQLKDIQRIQYDHRAHPAAIRTAPAVIRSDLHKVICRVKPSVRQLFHRFFPPHTA